MGENIQRLFYDLWTFKEQKYQHSAFQRKDQERLALLLLGEELPSQTSIYFNDKNKTPEIWVRPNHLFLHTLLYMVNPENIPPSYKDNMLQLIPFSLFERIVLMPDPSCEGPSSATLLSMETEIKSWV